MFKEIKTWLIIAALLTGGTAVTAQIYKYKHKVAQVEAELLVVTDQLSIAQTEVLEKEGFTKEQEVTIEELQKQVTDGETQIKLDRERHRTISDDLKERLDDANKPDPTHVITGEGEVDDTITVTDKDTGEECTADITITGDCVFTLVPNAKGELHAKGSWFGKAVDKATGKTVSENTITFVKPNMYKLPPLPKKVPVVKERSPWYAGLGGGVTTGGTSMAVIAGKEVKIPLLGKWLILGSYEQGTVETYGCIDPGSNGCYSYTKDVTDFDSWKAWGLKRF